MKQVINDFIPPDKVFEKPNRCMNLEYSILRLLKIPNFTVPTLVRTHFTPIYRLESIPVAWSDTEGTRRRKEAKQPRRWRVPRIRIQ